MPGQLMAALMPPRTVRARANLIAAEQGLLGVSAGVVIAVAVFTAMHGADARLVVRPALWIAAGLAAAGLVWTVATRRLRYGRWDRDRGLLTAAWLPAVVPTAVLLLFLLPTAVLWPVAVPGARPGNPSGDDSHAALLTLWLSVPVAILLLTTVTLRGIAAAEQRAFAPLAELAQPVAHALLGGLATVLMVGLIGGTITAELTYQLGAAVVVAGAATILWTGRVLRSGRVALQRARSAGTTWPMAERGYRTATVATLLGLVVPAMVVLADLMSARLTGMVLACAALAVSNHAIRFGWTLMRCGLQRPAA